jgi:holo-[acyl-carrier protein] synthase
MIVGVGIDVVEVARIERILARHGERALGRLFTAAEVETCAERTDQADCLAARFAAKEAALKALGSGKIPDIRWVDLEVTRAPSGKPSLNFRRGAGSLGKKLGVDSIWLSLSHEGGYACAVVVLESTKV